MTWSFKIGSIMGIPFRIHFTFLLLLMLVAVGGVHERGTYAALSGVLFICSVFFCVLVHELSHSLQAIRFGQKVESITLLPIGGVASMHSMPENPREEITMSVTGPLVNVVIAGLLFLVYRPSAAEFHVEAYPSSTREFITSLMTVNIVLSIFNLIPAFPMDGGRVLRGLLAMRKGFARATRMAVVVGQGMAMLFIFFAPLMFGEGGLWLSVIGFFIYLGASNEERGLHVRQVFRHVTVKDVMSSEFHTVSPEDALSKTLEHIYHGCQDDFPVVIGGKVAGILTKTKILSSLHSSGSETRVGEVMDTNIHPVSPMDLLEEVYRQALSNRNAAIPVVDGDALVGIVALENISRYFMVQSAMLPSNRQEVEE